MVGIEPTSPRFALPLSYIVVLTLIKPTISVLHLCQFNLSSERVSGSGKSYFRLTPMSFNLGSEPNHGYIELELRLTPMSF